MAPLKKMPQPGRTQEGKNVPQAFHIFAQVEGGRHLFFSRAGGQWSVELVSEPSGLWVVSLSWGWCWWLTLCGSHSNTFSEFLESEYFTSDKPGSTISTRPLPGDIVFTW